MNSVWDVLGQRAGAGSTPGARDDGHRVALAIEGGGMRGTISAGMSLALHRSGLLAGIDDVYGASAGAINGAWLLSSRPEDIAGWVDPRWARQAIGVGNLLRRRPYIDVARLVHDIYVHQAPLDYASVLANPIRLHPMATDASTGQSVDLAGAISNVEELRTAIEASCTMPVAAGRPVRFAGSSFTDAGVSEPVPIGAAIADGATHVLVLRTRDRGYSRPESTSGIGQRVSVAVLGMAGYSPAIATQLAGRAARGRAHQLTLEAGLVDGPRGQVRLATVWPGSDLVQPARTERRGERLRPAFDGGHAAFEQARLEAAGAAVEG